MKPSAPRPQHDDRPRSLADELDEEFADAREVALEAEMARYAWVFRLASSLMLGYAIAGWMDIPWTVLVDTPAPAVVMVLLLAAPVAAWACLQVMLNVIERDHAQSLSGAPPR